MPRRTRDLRSTTPPGTRNVRAHRAGHDDLSTAIVPPASASSTTTKRTGQACDRCKNRKIKCDAQPNGCAECKRAKEQCQVTDRNTGQVQRRGQLEAALAQLTQQEEYIKQLKEQIVQCGVQPRDPPSGADDPVWTPNVHRDSERTAKLAAFNAQNVGENYLGEPGHPQLSTIQGSQITLFDNTFDLEQYFLSAELNSNFDLTSKEFNNYTQLQLAVRKPPRPTYEDAKSFTGLFFRGVSFFTPIVDKRAFFQYIDLLYHEDAEISDTNVVIFHMVMSLTEFQTAVRDRRRREDLGQIARERLLWCLTHVQRLLREESLSAMQALALMCQALRNLQRPGPAWSFCDQVLTRAIELGLHRSLDTWRLRDQREHDPHHKSLRQRVFWSIMVVHVNISGNLGRPMRLRFEDIDTEIPEPINDPASGIDIVDENTCSWIAAPYGFRLTQIMLQVYSTVCAIRSSPSISDSSVNAFSLDKQLVDFERSLPQKLSGSKASMPTAESPLSAITLHVAGLYLRLGVQATRLIIYHPRHLRSPPYELSDQHLDKLMETSRKILEIGTTLALYHSLDTTIYYNMDFIYAIFVALFVTGQRANTFEDNTEIAAMYRDMSRWYKVLDQVGNMLGSGLKLKDRIQGIAVRTLGQTSNTAKVAAQDSIIRSPSQSHSSGEGTLDSSVEVIHQSLPVLEHHSSYESQHAPDPEDDGLYHASSMQQQQRQHMPHDAAPEMGVPLIHPLAMTSAFEHTGDLPANAMLIQRNPSGAPWETAYTSMNIDPVDLNPNDYLDPHSSAHPGNGMHYNQAPSQWSHQYQDTANIQQHEHMNGLDPWPTRYS